MAGTKKDTEIGMNMTQKGRWGGKSKQNTMLGTQLWSGNSGRQR